MSDKTKAAQSQADAQPKNAKEPAASGERFVVIRSFDGYEVGAELDATGWPFGRTSALTSQRYIRAAGGDDPKTGKETAG